VGNKIIANVAIYRKTDKLRTHRGVIADLAVSDDLGSSSQFAHKLDQTVRLWDVATRRPLLPSLAGHTDSVNGIAFSPDGKLLASASRDKTVRLWDVSTRMPIGLPLEGHTAYVERVTFSPDGKLLASSSWDRTVRLWNVDAESWIALSCSIANRNLSLQEWQTYFGSGISYRRTCQSLPNGEGVKAFPATK
jgi:WD40 repeat protein